MSTHEKKEDDDITYDFKQFEYEKMSLREKGVHNIKNLFRLAMEMVPWSSQTRPFSFEQKMTISNKYSIGISILGILMFAPIVYVLASTGKYDTIITNLVKFESNANLSQKYVTLKRPKKYKPMPILRIQFDKES